MKSLVRWCVVPLLATTLVAQTAAKPKPKKATPRASAVTAKDIQGLRDALAAQQQQIEQLKQEMQSRDAALQQAQQQVQQTQQQLQQAQSAAGEAQQKAAAVETASNEQKDTVSKLSGQLADVQTTLTNNAIGTQDEQKRMGALEGLVGRFRLSGDVRVRSDSIFQERAQARNRGRIRVRLGLDGKLNEDFTGGIYLATGSLGDPTTTNETLTNFFDRKTVSLDRGFITYNPVAHKWLSLTGGKFAYTWARTPQTFDSDLNPEGFSERFSFDLKTPFLKNFTFGGMQLLFNESTGGTDSFVIGGQASAKFVIGVLTSTPSFSYLKWNNPDAILNASLFATQATTTTGGVPVPGEGPGCRTPQGTVAATAPALRCVFAPNNMTNAIFSDAAGSPHFLSKFGYADLIVNNQIKTPSARLPINILLEYLNNLDAADHPLDTTGAVLTDLGKQSHVYLVDVSVGQLRNKNDVQLGYAWARQEQDSVIASFNESDQRAPTNILQHRIYANWRLRSNVVATFTWWRGRTLNSFLQNSQKGPGVAVGAVEPYLNRVFFDLVYSF